MRKMFFMLVSSVAFMVGPCGLDSWNVAVDPGLGVGGAFLGIGLDFGNLDFVVPIVPFSG